ncbi:hypothetical protein BDP27DRAFT_1366262 [Rhodocollybia butyracea]|uniref:Uncharacterized protein n=1 Tax=Rhodocollybia butyracea TaxID=206335 RepID=A0A9P5U4H6_9AGAR|nr:hypothetical protein BDP27DRAFT_1366262 [Rhodocollybia butyracea]
MGPATEATSLLAASLPTPAPAKSYGALSTSATSSSSIGYSNPSSYSNLLGTIEVKFNAKSAGVTSMLLVMAIVDIWECCPPVGGGVGSRNKPRICEQCYYLDPVHDPFHQSAVKSLMYFRAVVLIFRCVANSAKPTAAPALSDLVGSLPMH